MANSSTPQLPTFAALLTSISNDYREMTAYYGYNNGVGLPVSPGSEVYIRFSALSGQRAVMYQALNVAINNNLISTASGTNLDRVAANFGDTRRGATNCQGFVQLMSTIPITLLQGSLLTGPNSLQYQVAQYGVYNPGAFIQVASVDTGSQTNLPIGAIMSWQTPQANMQSTCLVAVALTGGIDSEDDATLRNRLYLSLQSPAGMANGQNLVTLAGSVDGIIQQPFIYNNFNGAGTQLIALTGYQTTSYIGRDVPHLLTDNYVKPYGISELQPGLLLQTAMQSNLPFPGIGAYNFYTTANGDFSGNYGSNLSVDTSAIYGQLPGPVANPYATVISTVNNYPTSMATVLTLPYPVGSAISGYGGGWADSVPWPNPDGYFVTEPPQVSLVVGPGTKITGGQTGAVGFGINVIAPSSGLVHTSGSPYASFLTYNNNTPTAGATHIQWVNRSDEQDTGWTAVQSTIIDFKDNGNDTWQLVLDTPLVFGTDGYDFYGNTGVAIGDFIFPASFNGQSYLNAIMLNYALLGPGQATASTGLLVLGASRYPASNTQFPAIMGAQVEKYLETNFNEVYSASVNPNNGTAYNSAFSPPSVNAPPNIYVPYQLGFWPEEFWGFGNQGSILA